MMRKTKWLALTAAALLAAGRRSVRAMGEGAACAFFPYLGPEEPLQNCNTPEQMRTAQDLWQRYAAWSDERGRDLTLI